MPGLRPPGPQVARGRAADNGQDAPCLRRQFAVSAPAQKEKKKKTVYLERITGRKEKRALGFGGVIPLPKPHLYPIPIAVQK